MADPILPLGPVARSWVLKQRYHKWFQDVLGAHSDGARYCAVTLTLKQAIDWSGTLERIDRDKTSTCLRCFLGALNSSVYNHAYRRHGKKLACFPVIERAKISERWHIHMMLEIPFFMTPKKFFELFSAKWRRNEWSRKEFQIDLLPTQSDVLGWTKYCLKDFPIDDETVDLPNLQLPAADTRKVSSD